MSSSNIIITKFWEPLTGINRTYFRNMPTYSSASNQYLWLSLHWNYFSQSLQAVMDVGYHRLRRVFISIDLVSVWIRWETEQWYENPPQLLSFDIVTDFLAVFPFYFEFLIRMALRTAWIIYNLLFRQVVYCSLRIYCFIPMCEDF